MKEKEGRHAVLKSLLGVAVALVVCALAYTAITFYVNDKDEIELGAGTQSPGNSERPDADADVPSVVTKTEEVFYERFEIDKDVVSSIIIGEAKDESIAGVKNPNGATESVITLMTKGVRFVQIVYPKGDSSAEVAAWNFNKELALKTGYLLPVVADNTKETAYEILVGATNRTESETALSYMVSKLGTYAVQTTDSKLVLVGNNTTALNKAITYAVGLAKTQKGEATIAKNSAYSWNSTNAYHNTILSGKNAAVTTAKLYDVNEAEAQGVPQGGCSDGTYLYQMLITKQVTSDENLNECKIVKVDLKTGATVMISDPLPLNHANDVTYNSKKDVLVVCHNAPNRDTVSYVDPKTLTITETFKIDYEIYCIDYNAARDAYVVGLSGGQTFRILDGSFKASGKVHLPDEATKSHVTQGVGSDDEFIYFALYKSGAKSVIAVFDWEGNFVNLLTLYSMDSTGMQGREIETVIVADGVFYISCASQTWKYSQIYKITDLNAQ